MTLVRPDCQTFCCREQDFAKAVLHVGIASCILARARLHREARSASSRKKPRYYAVCKLHMSPATLFAFAEPTLITRLTLGPGH